MCVHSYQCNLHANLPQWDKLEKQLQFANDSIAWPTDSCSEGTGKGLVSWLQSVCFLSINVSNDQCFGI